MPRVSVIIPTYGHAAYVLHTLESVAAQTFRDYEIIVINDGSPDHTAELLQPWAASGRIRYHEQLNRGQAAARNAGLQHATGELLAFLDDDDLWPADSLAWRVEALRDASLGAVAGVAEFIDEKAQTYARGQFVPELTVDRLFHGNPLMSPGQVLMRATLVREAGGFHEEVWGADDWHLWFELARRSRFSMQDRVALQYRVHPGNATAQARRLFLGCHQVAELQLGKEKAGLRDVRRRGVYRMLYHGWGPGLARELKKGFQQKNWSEVRHGMKALGKLLQGSIAEPRIPFLLAGELFPSSHDERQ